jgi:hypothetical protein
MRMTTLTLTLGQAYTIPIASVKRARAWRARLKEPLNQVLGAVNAVTTVQLETTADLTALAEQLLPILMDATDTLLDLILAYAPALDAQREAIEDTAVDEEVVDAFLVLLKAAFPLARLLDLLGPVTQATSKSSPAPSGA